MTTNIGFVLFQRIKTALCEKTKGNGPFGMTFDKPSPEGGKGEKDEARRKAPTPAAPAKPARGLSLIGVGTILASMVLSGFILGYWADVWLDTKPLFMLLFASLGFVGGILKIHKLLA